MNGEKTAPSRVVKEVGLGTISLLVSEPTRKTRHVTCCTCLDDNSVSFELETLDPQKRELLEARFMGRALPVSAYEDVM